MEVRLKLVREMQLSIEKAAEVRPLQVRIEDAQVIERIRLGALNLKPSRYQGSHRGTTLQVTSVRLVGVHD
jgi:hypothetical protein